MKIRTKHFLLLIGPLLAVMSIYAYVSISKDRESRLKEVQTQAMVLAQGLRVTLEDRLLEGRLKEIKAIADQIRDKTRLFRISVFDKEGRPLAGFPISNEKASERSKGLEMTKSPSLPGSSVAWPLIWKRPRSRSCWIKNT